MMASMFNELRGRAVAMWQLYFKEIGYVILFAMVSMGVAAPLELQATTAGDVAPYGAPDGRLDAGDLGVMMQFLNGVKQPDSIEKMTVDVAPYRSPDGKLDINDYLLVQKALLGQLVLDPIIQPVTPLLWADSVAVSPFHISGLASPNSSVNVYLDGSLYTNITADGNGLFSTQVTLMPGATNAIYVRVIANNIEGPVSETVTVVLPNTPPATLDPSHFTVSYSDKVTVDGVIGSVPVGSTVVVTLVDGSVGQVAAKPDGSFNYSSSGGNTSRIATIMVRDGSGLQSDPTHMTTVGTIAGTFDVDSSGAASYSIPIAVPPGTAGMTPGLSLNYSSRGGNGPLGRGWSLGGMSMITRCAKTLAQDGEKGGVNLDTNDRFCLDGQRLLAINGDIYGANGTEYRTELETFTRIISYGTGNTPDSFKVWSRSGQLIEYGNTADAQFDPQGGAVLHWAANRIEDRAGNYLAVKIFRRYDNWRTLPC